MLINHKDQLQLELAKTADIPNILKLHRKYQINTIAANVFTYVERVARAHLQKLQPKHEQLLSIRSNLY